MEDFELRLKVPEKQPYEGKATQKQKQKLWDLGLRNTKTIDELGKRQASALIDQILGGYKEHFGKKNGRRRFWWGLAVVGCCLIALPFTKNSGVLGVLGCCICLGLVCLVSGIGGLRGNQRQRQHDPDHHHGYLR